MARISANKLGELLVTPGAARRRRIIYDQKYPKDSVVAIYRHAKAPIAAFLASDPRDTRIIDQAAVQLRADTTGTEWAQKTRLYAADALDEFIAMTPSLPLDGVTFRPGKRNAAQLNIQGVAISVQPDFIVTSERRGRRYCGALKLHFTKGDDFKLGRAGSEYVAVLLHDWLSQYGPSGHAPLHAHCLSVDVFRRSAVPAPRSVTRRHEDISAACEQVVTLWPIL